MVGPANRFLPEFDATGESCRKQGRGYGELKLLNRLGNNHYIAVYEKTTTGKKDQNANKKIEISGDWS